MLQLQPDLVLPAMTPAMSEKDWQSRVVDLARLLGYLVAHFRPAQTAHGWRTAMTGDQGFPDLVLVRPPRVIFVELKVSARVQPKQATWLDQLGASPGVEVYLWRPADWDTVLDVLRSRQRPTLSVPA